MVIPCAAPRSAWMAGFLSLAGKSIVAKAGEVLGCGPLLHSLYTSSWTWDLGLKVPAGVASTLWLTCGPRGPYHT